MSGRPEEQESIGALLARLIEDGRTLVKAELALARTDFYRRIASARMGALLLLIGAIMGQAAAVTFLVTLSFVLQPWIGRLGGAAVAVLFGVGLAVLLIRIGVRKLLLVIADDPDDADGDGIPDRRPTAVDELFQKVRERSQEARNQLVETMGETQARLHPQALIADLADLVVDQVEGLAQRATSAAKRRPVRTVAALVALALVVIRPPLYRIANGLLRATGRRATSLRRKPGDPTARSNHAPSDD